MVSSDEINRRLEAKRRGVKYQDPHEKRRMETESSNTRECPSCNTQNPSTAKFCVGCGEKLDIPEPELKPEPEKEYSPEIKGPEEPAIEKPIQNKQRITQRPDDFSKSRKLEPIVPPEQRSEPPITEQETEPEPLTTKEQETEPQKPPEVKRPKTIPTPQPKVETTPTPEQAAETEPKEPKVKSDVDPVERIKKAKELLDLGAITQEDFDKIKSKYLDEI